MEINAVLCWLLPAVRQSHFILKGVLACPAQEPEQTALVFTDTLLRTPCFLSSVYKYRDTWGTDEQAVAIRDPVHQRNSYVKKTRGMAVIFPS